MKTDLIIKVSIQHDTKKAKHQGLEVWCEGLKAGQTCRGLNGMGEGYNLEVKSIKEMPKKRK